MGTILTSTGGTTMVESMTTGATNAITFMNQAIQAMTANDYLLIFLGITMLGAGVGLFRKLRRGT